MQKPWEKYQAEYGGDKPWEKYQSEHSGSMENPATPVKPEKSSVERFKEWLSAKMEQQKKKNNRPFLTALTEELGNAPLGPAAPVNLIAKSIMTGDRSLPSVGADVAKSLTPLSILKLVPREYLDKLVSVNAPTPARLVKGLAIDPALGTSQLASRATGIGKEKVQNAVDKTSGYYSEHFDESPSGEAAGGMLSTGVSRALKEAPVALTAAQKLMRVGGSGLKGGAIAAGYTPESNVKDDTDYWYRKGNEFALGFLAGGGADAAAQVSKGNPSARVFGNEQARGEALDRAEQIRSATRSERFPEGAEPSLGEVLQSPTLQRAENITEYIPFSGAKNRLSKQNEAVAAKLQEMSDQANTKIGPGGAGASIMESARNLLKKRKGEYGVEYDSIRDAVDESGVRVTPKDAITEAYKGWHRLKQTTGNDAAIKDMENLILELESGSYGDTFGKLQGERRGMMRKVRDIMNSASPDSALAAHRQSVAKGFESDMNRALMDADPSGALAEKFGNVNKGYVRDVINYKPDQPSGMEGYRPEAKKLHGRELFSDTTAESILKGDNPQMAQYVKYGTDKAGHEAIQAAIIQDISKSAHDAGGFVSPRKGASAVERHKNFINEFFPGSSKDEIVGLGNALSALERSGQFMERLQTGRFASALAVGGQIGAGAGLVTNPVATTGVIGAVRLFNRLSSSRAGKEWLLNAAKHKPDSPEMAELVRDLPKILGIGIGDMRENK